MTRRDAGLMKDRRDRRPVGILLLHKAVWVEPSPVRGELARHLFCWTSADPWLGRASIEAEAERGSPPRNYCCPGHVQPDKMRHQQAIGLIANESAKEV